MMKVTDKWNDFLGELPASQTDIYFREEYVRLYQDADNRAECFVYREDERLWLMPVLTRGFLFEEEIYKDFETAYGYGGPATNFPQEDFLDRAAASLRKYCLENNYIAGFVRLHPLLDNARLLRGAGEVLFDRHTVAMDLRPAAEEIMSGQVHPKNRNVIRKAAKQGLQFTADYGYEHIGEFIRLYGETMDKLSADGFYYFDSGYYREFTRDIGNSFLGVVTSEGKVISAAIFMYDGIYGHYHLSGSDRNYLELCPNNFMLYYAAMELKTNGVEWLHLGGGSSPGEDNSLLAFKKRFSPNFFDFNIGKCVFNDRVYQKICSDWEVKNPDKKERHGRLLLKYKY